ncbi:SRPBCC family protein [Streptomyces cadmiisoli]|uniref:Carbon monoxide dehydrogenase subunit G n=1 Tax=Streptomyces cadmiisoli TaxID=2184053 RepID=A0A2Z4J0E3_9ACTN|nr:SRPBCC family protein [Streptomyces cadmiisoli]AWW38477.1 carbon monoxide dehydrogenase subunit G [Streptomyces cadmiisoli]
MEHEVFVPVPSDLLGAVLADPARVARAVPGLQQDAGAGPLAGRLKVRLGNTTITYRGAVRVAEREDGSYAVEGDATETRGTGSVKIALTLRVRAAEGGSVLVVDGTASADGRVTELPADTVASAVTRLLDRTAEGLGTEATATTGHETAKQKEAEAPESAGTGTAEVAAEAPEAVEDGTAEAGTTESVDAGSAEERASVFDTEVPPPSLAPEEDDTAVDDRGEAAAADEGFAEDSEPPAEAAHARRTMIGRSAEEVDHAPPRGRYAPVPAPQTVAPSSALRWAAPAAAVVLASAIVLGRALRRRR